MKNKFLTLAAVLVVAITACGCTNTTQTTIQEPQTESQIKQENPIITATPQFANSLSGILNSGYSIVNKEKVYYTQSGDWEKVYFVGTVTEKGGQYYNSIWATNDVSFIGAGLVFSMNDYAIQASGMGDGRTNAEPINETDDGYSRINQKLLSDMSQILQ